MQSRERGYVIPPPQARFGVTHSETGNEAADFMQVQKETAQIADVSRVSTDEIGPQSLRRGSGKAPKMPYFDEERDLWTATWVALKGLPHASDGIK